MLGPWKSLPAAWLGIGLYAVLAGASAGVVRAAVMGVVVLLADGGYAPVNTWAWIEW